MNRTRGFTLIELIVTMVLLGILAAAAAIYLRPAIDAYFGTQRRAELTDIADTAARRMTRELRLALPNSAQSATSGLGGVNAHLQILLVRNGGRYRAVNDDDTPSVTTEDILDFTVADSGFDTLGNLPTTPADQLVRAGDFVVIQNLGIAGANAYNTAAAKPNIAQIQTYTAGGGALPNEDRIAFTANTQFPLESPGRRFFVVSGPVTYSCLPGAVNANGDGTGTLQRWSGYTIASGPPTALPAGATNSLLANFVTSCSILYTTLAVQGRGLVQITLGLTRANEVVTLYYEAHVDNVP